MREGEGREGRGGEGASERDEREKERGGSKERLQGKGGGIWVEGYG